MDRLHKEILRLAVPSILANITVPIVGMVDVAIAGHLPAEGMTGAAAYIGGISIGSLLFDLLYWGFAFLRAGTGGLTAQAYGRDDVTECARLFVRAVGLALGISVLIMAVQWPFSKLAFLIVDCSPEVKTLALKYFFIRIWAAPATLSLMSFRGWFIGMQDSVSSMMTDLVVNVVNILASVFLATGFSLLVPSGSGSAGSGFFAWQGMGFPGVALGTVVAQYSGLLYASLVVLLKYRRRIFADFHLQDIPSAFNFSGRQGGEGELRSFLSMNTDLFVRSLCFIGIYIGFTVISARYGDLMLASSTIMMKLLMIFSYFTDGFAYAGEALTGRFIGERSEEKTRRAIRCVFGWSMSVVLVFVVLYWAGGVPLLRLMTSDEGVINACRQFLPWLVLMPLIGCPAFTWDGIYVGATASRGVRNGMLAALVAFFAVWFVGIGILNGIYPDAASALPDSSSTMPPERYQAKAIHILMVAYFAHLLARAIVLTVLYRREILSRWFPEKYQAA